MAIGAGEAGSDHGAACPPSALRVGRRDRRAGGRERGGVEVRAIDARGDRAQRQAGFDQAPARHLIEEPERVRTPRIGRGVGMEARLGCARQRSRQRRQDRVAVDCEPGAAREQRGDIGGVGGRVAKARGAIERAQQARERVRVFLAPALAHRQRLFRRVAPDVVGGRDRRRRRRRARRCRPRARRRRSRRSGPTAALRPCAPAA